MKQWLIWSVTLALLVPAPRFGLKAADAASEEDRLIQVLQSTASLQDKDAACARLKFIGTDRCVPVLAALLTDEQLSHSARYALEAMFVPQAGDALLAALPKTSGLIRLGLINSLGMRGQREAVPALIKLLADADSETAVASAWALGHIGRPEAIRPLQNATGKSSPQLHRAATDALLACACRLLDVGNRSKAAAVFQRVYDHDKNPSVRLAAYRGLLRSSGNGLRLMISAITGQPGPEQAAALQLVREAQFAGATEALARLLPRLTPPIQIALVDGLAQRGDPAAATPIAALAGSSDPSVRPAILQALGRLGDATTVPLLAPFAASGTPPEQSAARLALVTLNRGPVDSTMVDQLRLADPGVQAELARALGERSSRAAVPRLMKLALDGPDSTRNAALRAMGQLVDPQQLGSLVKFVLDAKDENARREAADAVRIAYQRLAFKSGQLDLEPLLKGMQLGSKDARIVLLPICSGLAFPQVRVTLRMGLVDPDPQVRAAAVRALCDTIDPELLEDIVTLARLTKEETFRTLATAAGVRLATQEESVKISRGQRVAVLRALLGAADRPELKRKVLAGLGEVPDPDALRLVEPLLQEPGVQSEASRAAIKIALGLPSVEAQNSLAILNKGLASAADEPTRNALQAAMKQIQDSADFITDWLVAGPYRQPGRNFSALFDIVFPPETDDPKGVAWTPLPAGTDAKRPMVLDLLRALGGQQCVAYARTWVHTEKDLSALLELGSDDGIKAWVNDKQVYALNVARPLQVGSDKVAVKFHAGWNMLLLKITQNDQMWEFCARLLNPDGSHLEGLQVEAAPKTASAKP